MTTHRLLAQTTPFAVATTLILSLAACGGDAEATPVNDTAATPIAVAVATVHDGLVATPVTATGTFGSRDEVPLAFKIGGVIARIAVDQGATVRRGQLLAALDLREIDALVDKARVGAEKAERDVARLKRLVADSVATFTQLQDAQSALDAARADYAAARVNREYATIVAPDNGVILQRPATPGTTMNAGAPVLILGGTARGRVLRVGLPDRDALRVRLGDSATVQFDAVPATRYHGSVTLLSKAADARTGTYTVEITLRGTDALPNGLVGRAEIAVRATSTASLLPVDALIEADHDSATVYTLPPVAPLKAEAHRVRITQLVGDQAAVTGLEAGARVITRGAPYVTPGALVRITVADGATAARANTDRGARP